MNIHSFPLLDGPLCGTYASLLFRPLDGSEHLFSDTSIDARTVAYHYVFSEFRRGFIHKAIENQPSEQK